MSYIFNFPIFHWDKSTRPSPTTGTIAQSWMRRLNGGYSLQMHFDLRLVNRR